MFGKKKEEVVVVEKSWYEKLKNSYVIVAVAYVVFGLSLLIRPDTSVDAICYALGAICLIYSISTLIKYFLSDKRRLFIEPDFILPIIMVIVGLIIIFRHDVIISVVHIVAGIVFIVSGIVKLQDCFNVRKNSFSKWWIVLIFALVAVVLGVMMLFDLFGADTLLIRMIGLFFTIDGVLSIASAIILKISGGNPASSGNKKF
ncbi:MAG: DUF308 domain-containing protein [Lachnospira sp.]|nr:DUF308 domain-containing protein [Lachnospira sp.]